MLLPPPPPLPLHSQQFHVFELTRTMPRFAMYSLLLAQKQTGLNEPGVQVGVVTFHLNERINRVLPLPSQPLPPYTLSHTRSPQPGSDVVEPELPAIRRPLYRRWQRSRRRVPISARRQQLPVNQNEVHRTGSALPLAPPPCDLVNLESTPQVSISSDSMNVVGDVIQALCQYLKVEDLPTIVDFPHETEYLRDILHKVTTLIHTSYDTCITTLIYVCSITP